MNRELAVLRSLFNRCKEWGKFEGENPVNKVKFMPEPKERVRFLEHDEEARLLDVERAQEERHHVQRREGALSRVVEGK